MRGSRGVWQLSTLPMRGGPKGHLKDLLRSQRGVIRAAKAAPHLFKPMSVIKRAHAAEIRAYKSSAAFGDFESKHPRGYRGRFRNK